MTNAPSPVRYSVDVERMLPDEPELVRLVQGWRERTRTAGAANLAV